MSYTPNKWHRQKNTWRILAGTRPVVEINSYNDDAEQVAALVVAAPELLEARQAMHQAYPANGGSMTAAQSAPSDKARAAIAKATQS